MNYGEQCNVANVVGFEDSNLSRSLLPSVSPQPNTDFGEPGNQTTTVGPSSPSVVIDVGDENDFNHPRHGTRLTILQWIFMLNALSLEMLSACFDQLSSPNKSHYALVSFLLAIAAVLTCILELIYNGIKEGVESTNGMVFGTLPDIFGLGLSVIQCLCSAEQYYFLHRHENNPMKLSPVPLVFFLLFGGFEIENELELHCHSECKPGDSRQYGTLSVCRSHYSFVECQRLDFDLADELVITR